MNFILNKSNSVGAIASSICLVHCLITPILFVAKVCSASCCAAETTPTWWKMLDLLFLGVALFAVYHSAKVTTKKWIGVGLWVSWFVLALVIANEYVQFAPVYEYAIYFPSLSLVLLHVYNSRYCHCNDDSCSVEVR